MNANRRDEALRAAIADSRYEVDPERVAAELIARLWLMKRARDRLITREGRRFDPSRATIRARSRVLRQGGDGVLELNTNR